MKRIFRQNLTTILVALREKQILHGHISSKTAWVDVKGVVKLAWFEDAQCVSCGQSMSQDTSDANKLFQLLGPLDEAIDGDQFDADDDQHSKALSLARDTHAAPCKIPYACKANACIHSLLN